MADEPIYLNNDIVDSLTDGYKNSHWTPERLHEWKRTGEYPYRSTVVWPLRGLQDPTSSNGQGQWELLGFLSIDSSETDVFHRDTIQPLGEALAHAGYTGLVLYRLWREEEW